MQSVLYANQGVVTLGITCPSCKFSSKYDIGFIETAIKENRWVMCIACQDRFQILITPLKRDAVEHCVDLSSDKQTCPHCSKGKLDSVMRCDYCFVIVDEGGQV